MKDDASAVQHYTTLIWKGSADEKGASPGIEDPRVRINAKNAQSITLPLEGGSIPPILEYLPSPHSMANLWCLHAGCRGQEDLFVSTSKRWWPVVCSRSRSTVIPSMPDKSAPQHQWRRQYNRVYQHATTRLPALAAVICTTRILMEKYNVACQYGSAHQYPAWESQPPPFANGKKIVCFHPIEKNGGSDLWMVQKTSEGKWGAASLGL